MKLIDWKPAPGDPNIWQQMVIVIRDFPEIMRCEWQAFMERHGFGLPKLSLEDIRLLQAEAIANCMASGRPVPAFILDVDRGSPAAQKAMTSQWRHAHD